MSGSPVYLDGKLAGALAFRIGEFSKEPIAGVTPIAEMLEINAMDRSPDWRPVRRRLAAVKKPTKTSGPGVANVPITRLCQLSEADRNAAGFQRILQETHAAFCARSLRRGNRAGHGRGLGQRREAAGTSEPGSAISAVLVRGDMDIAATCTVTYMDAAAPAGLRPSAAAIWHGGFAHDEGASGGHAAVAAQRLQDRERHRAGRRLRPGSPHRNHGRVRQAARHDSRHPEHSRRAGTTSSFITRF